MPTRKRRLASKKGKFKGKSGIKPKWKSTQELGALVDGYFKSITTVDEETGDEKYKKPPTVSGLALFLNSCRQTLVTYEGRVGGRELKHFSEEERGQFVDIIRGAKARINAYMEERGLMSKINVPFAMFLMKNNSGYRDQQEIKNTGTQTSIVFNVKNEKERKEIENFMNSDD